MNIDLTTIINSASFVANSILICLGCLIIVATILVIDNLLHKFWKPVKVVWYVNGDETADRDTKTARKETQSK